MGKGDLRLRYEESAIKQQAEEMRFPQENAGTKQPRTMKVLKFILDHMKGKKLPYLLCLCAISVLGILLLFPTVFIGNLIDQVLYKEGNITWVERALRITQETSTADMLIRYVAAIIGTTIFLTLLRSLARSEMHRIGTGTAVKLRLTLYEKLQTLSTGFYASTPSGELISNLTSDVTHVDEFIKNNMYDWVKNVSLFIYTLVLLFYYHTELTLILTAFLPVFTVLSYIIFRYTRTLHQRLRDHFSEMNTYVNENLGAYRVVKAFAKEDYEIQKLEATSKEYFNIAVSNVHRRLNLSTPLHLVGRLMSICGLCLAAIYVINGNMTIGTLTIFNTFIFSLQDPIRVITTLVSTTQQMMVSARKIHELYETEPEVENTHHIIGKHSRVHTIEFRNVSLTLSGHQILKNINLTIRRGQTLAIMGPTGAGKTILISLLIRLYDPTEGAIYLNGVDIKEIDLQQLRKEMAIATQDVFLFSDTIDGNIAYSNPEMDEDTVHDVAEAAQAASFIEKLSDGYDTVIGEQGIGLSGGQRQRIALARAMAKDSSVIILDDTTSAVDMETEANILHELRRITNKTKIIVAQRISSVTDADEIIVLQEGAIAERGTHEQLLENDGYYAEIYRISRQNEEVEHHG